MSRHQVVVCLISDLISLPDILTAIRLLLNAQSSPLGSNSGILYCWVGYTASLCVSPDRVLRVMAHFRHTKIGFGRSSNQNRANNARPRKHGPKQDCLQQIIDSDNLIIRGLDTESADRRNRLPTSEISSDRCLLTLRQKNDNWANKERK